MNIAEIRQKYPQYQDLSDGELVRGLHKRFYSDMPYANFLKSINFSEASDPTQGMSGTQKFLAGAGKAFTDVGRGVGQLTGLTSQSSVDEAQALDAPLMKTGAGIAGNITGNVAALAPAAMIPGVNTYAGAAALGGASGALQPVPTGESRAFNTGTGAAAGILGQGGANAIGRAVQPIKNSLTREGGRVAQEAERMGIPLTVGQATGSKPVQLVESALERIPVLGKPMEEIRQSQRGAFTRAVTKTFGENSDEVSQPLMRQAKDRIGGEFDRLYQGMKLDARSMQDDLGSVMSDASKKLRPDDAGMVGGWMDDLLSKVDDSGAIDGAAYQVWRTDINSAIKGESNGFVKKTLTKLRDIADKEGYAKVADKDALKTARQQYGAMKTVEPLAEKASTGHISPALLQGRVMQGVDNFAYGGGGDLGQLAKVGQGFVKDQVPDSGTAQRLLAQGAMTGGIAGGVGGLGMLTDAETAARTAALIGILGGGARLGLTNPALMQYLKQGASPGVKSAAEEVGRYIPAATIGALQ